VLTEGLHALETAMPKRVTEQGEADVRQRGRRRPPEPAADPRSDRILTAAERLFAERGYESVTVRDIATVAGVTHPLIYYHWDSKRGLLAAVLERNQRRVRSLVELQTGPREAVLAIIRNYLGEGRLYLLIMARSFLRGMPVVDWPGGYPGMGSAIDALLTAGPGDDPAWDEKVREVVSLITAMLCGWVLMGEQIMDVAAVAQERREESSELLLASIDDLLARTLASAQDVR
jgi:TetR/AcrR family transcriptional regulator, repressor for neighboring sulfatase